MMPINTIIFDLGGVLIDWNPEYVFLKAFNHDKKKTEWFLNTICTSDWNENQDAGYPLEKATREKIDEFPEYETYIRMFYGQWEQMLGGAIEGSVNILDTLTKLGTYKILALTNWSHETFPIAKKRFPFLEWFDGIVVSGEEKTRKPFDLIYNILLDRFSVTPQNALFIDDNLRNVKAAESLQINAIHFQSPKMLISQLKNYNIII